MYYNNSWRVFEERRRGRRRKDNNWKERKKDSTSEFNERQA